MPNMIDKIAIGVADLFYTEPGGTTEVYLGLTKGGGEFVYETEWHDIDGIDQYGKTAVDSILIGEKASYKTSVVDTSLASIKRVAPTATELKDGGTLKALGFGQRPGLRMQSVAGKLRIHPISAGLTDRSRDIIIYKSGSKAKLNLSFKLDEEWVVPCEWNAYPDESRPIGDNLFRIGDEEISGGLIQRVVSMDISPSNPTIDHDGTPNYIMASVSAVHEDTSTADYTDEATWSSSDDGIATVSNAIGTKGKITGVAAGTVVITATYAGYSTSTSVTIT